MDQNPALSEVLMAYVEEIPRSDVQGERGYLPCNLSHDAFDVTYSTPPPAPNYELTDACKNITSPQLRLRAVINGLHCVISCEPKKKNNKNEIYRPFP